MRDDAAQTICLCKFGKESDLSADPCSSKTHDGRLLSGAVVPSKIIGILYPDSFATFISFRGSREGGPEHSSQTDGTRIKTSQDESMTARLEKIDPSTIIKLDLTERTVGIFMRPTLGGVSL
jgi:hypothetical protein